MRQFRRTPIVLLILLLALIFGCGGGSSAPDPTPNAPTVLGIFPKDLSARSGSSVRFIAELNKPASSYLWDFGGGALPTTATTATEFQPLVILAAPGTYTATLTVCAAECADPFEFTYTVTPDEGPVAGPRILSVTPTGSVGARGATVTFSVQIEGDADIWEWDFGSGTSEQESTAVQPAMLLLYEGIHQGKVTVSLSGGGSDIVDFAYQIGPGIVEEPPVIEAINLAPTLCQNRTTAFSADIVSDFPVTFHWTTTGGTTPMISTNSIARLPVQLPAGTFAADLVVSNQFGDTREPFTFTTIDCAVATFERLPADDFPRGMIRLQVETSDPNSGAGAKVTGAGKLISRAALQAGANPKHFDFLSSPEGDVRGRIFADPSGPYVEFDFHTDLPAPPPALQRVFSFPQIISQPARIAIVGGAPAVLFVDDVSIHDDPANNLLTYARATSPLPSGTDDWVMQNLGIADNSGKAFELCEAAGRPVVIAHFHPEVMYFYADNATPSSIADWTSVQIGSTGSIAETLSIRAFEDGSTFTIISQQGQSAITTIQALTPNPLTISDFRNRIPALGRGLTIGTQQLAIFHDRPVIVTQDAGAVTGLRVLVSRTKTPDVYADWIDSRPTLPEINPVFAPLLVGTQTRLWILARQDGTRDIGSRYITTTTPMPTKSDWSTPVALHGVTVPVQDELLGATSDDRLVGCWNVDVGGPSYFRALTTTPQQGGDWVRMIPNVKKMTHIAVDQNRVWFTTGSQTSSKGIEVWTADLPW